MLIDIHKEVTPSLHNLFDKVSMDHPAAFISSQDDYLSKHLRKTDFSIPGNTFHFTSNGRFGLHDMIIHISSRIGNANTVVTSFNISVIAARLFIRAWDTGIFKSLKFVLNAQKKSNFADALQLIQGKFPIVYTSIHAKVALIWNNDHYISIITSGNLSNNQNIERGIISTCKDIFLFDKKWIDGLFS